MCWILSDGPPGSSGAWGSKAITNANKLAVQNAPRNKLVFAGMHGGKLIARESLLLSRGADVCVLSFSRKIVEPCF
jgi:hypothetical protein